MNSPHKVSVGSNPRPGNFRMTHQRLDRDRETKYRERKKNENRPTNKGHKWASRKQNQIQNSAAKQTQKEKKNLTTKVTSERAGWEHQHLRLVRTNTLRVHTRRAISALRMHFRYRHENAGTTLRGQFCGASRSAQNPKVNRSDEAGSSFSDSLNDRGGCPLLLLPALHTP